MNTTLKMTCNVNAKIGDIVTPIGKTSQYRIVKIYPRTICVEDGGDYSYTLCEITPLVKPLGETNERNSI